ncbi:MAG: response regulator [Pseudomonadota bacterium]
MDNQLSVYHHPTLTVLIDDSQSFLDSLAFQLNPQLAYKGFNDAQDAFNWLNHAHLHATKSESEPIRVGYSERGAPFEQYNAAIDLDRIYHIATNRQRFEIPSVLVIDYAMPQMNGVEFCQAVRGLPCKKILLTGQADEKIAIDAFNRRLIDFFIKKNDPDALHLLDAEIIKLQKGFFKGQTNTLKDLLSRHSYEFLIDPAIAALVESLCNRYRFVEYYSFPNPAGILFFDNCGKATLMVIETVAGLISHLEVAQDQDAPPELINALRKLKLLPFFSDTGGMYRDAIAQDWLSYCLPPQICHGRQDYYWALFDLPSHYLQSPVYPYGEFLRDHAAG